MEPAAATTMGMYCKKCGYDLRASGEAKRCPECGRVFSPDDPKTFRPRPFAAPWKRALGRWAKRAAILLLVLVLLLASLWGWLYWGWKQEQAALAEAGGEATRWNLVILGGAPGRWLHRRNIPGRFVLERARGAWLESATDSHLLPLRKLRELEELYVYGPITDAGLASLRQCPRLRKLSLHRPRVSASGLAALRDLPRLELLVLEEAALTDADLVGLDGLSQLEFLYLDGTPITDAGLVRLGSLRKLRWLSLQDTRVTDAGLIHLTPQLVWLNLTGTRVTDAGLVHLEKLRGLCELHLRNTQVTSVGVAKFQAVLPECGIEGP